MRFAALSSLGFLAILGCSAANTPNDFEGAGGQGGDSGGTFANGSGNGSNGSGGGFTTSTGAGAGGQICSDEAKLIYLLDSNNGLHSFDPPTKALKTIGTMNCSASMQPNSMAVDRNAVAWADYVASNGISDSAGSLFKVSTQNASCQPMPSVNLPMGWFRIGMGYSVDTAGGTAETLFIAGVADPLFGGSSGLGRVDPNTMGVIPIGQFTGQLTGQSAELTGTGDGRLYGFFTTTPVHVARIDKGTGAIDPSEDWPLPTVETPLAWAFSFWGGDFYLYTSPGVTDPVRTTNVTRFRPSDGSVDTAYMTNIGFHVVGAGVSTCAPLVPPN